MSANIPDFTRQGAEPLYPKVLFSRPVTRAGGGCLLIIGGYAGEFVAPTNVYGLSAAAGAGECRVALPATLAKVVGDVPGVAYVAASPSGSLGSEALGRLLELSETADALSVGASLSNNSHTAILLERLLAEVERPIIAYGDALAILQRQPKLLTDRTDALIILSMTDVYKLCTKLGVPARLKDGGLINKLEVIQELAAATKCDFAVCDGDIITAAAGQLTVTKVAGLEALPAAYWAVLGVWWQQNPTRRAEGLVTGAWVLGAVAAKLAETGAHASVSAVAAAIAKVLAENDGF
jgi:hypothetical protein